MLKFLAPFNYLYLSRLKSKLEIYSIIWIYPLYLFVFVFLIYGFEWIPGLFLFVLVLISWMSIYEIGYMENDAITIQKEQEPNIRIEANDIIFIQANFNKIVAFRILFFLSLMGVIFFSRLLPLNQVLFFIAYVAFTRLVFYLHNTIRSRWNIVTYFFLCVLKYFIIPIMFLGWNHGIEPYLIMLISFPLLRTMEHSVKSKYQFVKFREMLGSLDTFRVVYYSFCLALVVLGYFMFNLSLNWVYAIFYFFIFRAGIFLMIKMGVYSRKKI
jgi:hypothetical protein